MNALLREYLLHLFHATWQTSIVAAAALFVSRVASRSSTRFRAMVLGLAFWKFLLPPMIPAPTGLFSRIRLFGTEWFGGRSNEAGPVAVRIAAAVATIHLAGTVVVAARILAERRGLASLLRGARRRGNVRLAIAPDGVGPPVPVAFGFLRPAIVIPIRIAAGLKRADRRIVVAHERRHLELAHGLATSVEAWLGALWWFHPLWWVLIRERRRIREERCDEDVVAKLRLEPAEYASCLVRVAGLCAGAANPPGLSAMSGGASGIAARIRRFQLRAKRLSPREVAAAVALYAALLPGIRPWSSAARRLSAGSTIRNGVR